jgi:hypothetical protein
VAGEAQPLTAVGMGQLVLQRDGAGAWLPVAPDGLAAVLAPYQEPRGDFFDAFYDGLGRLRVAGGLDSTTGGVVSFTPDAGWSIAYDERAGGGVVEGSPLMSIAQAPCGELCGDFFAVFQLGSLVRSNGPLVDLLMTGGVITSIKPALNDGGLIAAGWGVFIPLVDWHQIAPAPQTGVLRSIYNPDQLYMVAVGTGGTVMRVTDAGWIEEHLAGDLWDVDGTAADDVWVVGARGSLRHFDGQAWHDVPAPHGGNLRAIAVTSEHVWVADDQGAIDRLDRP